MDDRQITGAVVRRRDLGGEYVVRSLTPVLATAREGRREFALLIGWAATEAALRLLAERNAVPVQRAATPVLLKELVSPGVIAREQYEVLWSLYQQRNAVAHGFATQQEPHSAERVVGVGRELLAEERKAA